MLIAIIGGGASGMAAALAAAEDTGNRVVLLERQARLGRKLQATGNGRCNLSNLHAGQGGYHGDTPGFSRFALTQFPPERTLEWFGALGLYTVAEESGRVYPYSDQANSVVDVPWKSPISGWSWAARWKKSGKRPRASAWNGRTGRWTATALSWPAAAWRVQSWAAPCPATSCCGAWATAAPGCGPIWCR